MLVMNLCDPAAPVSPVRFKSVQQLYSDNADDDSRTDSDEFVPSLRGNQRLDEWSDSDEDDDDEARVYPTGRKEVAYGQLVRRKEMSITQNQVFQSSYIQKEQKTAFKTLAQLIDPRANERVKYCHKQRKAFLAKKIAGRKRGPKPGKRKAWSKNLNDEGSINLIVDLVIHKDTGMPPDGLSSTSSTVVNGVTSLPVEDGLSAKLSSQESVNQDASLDQEEEEQCNVVTVSDPSSLTTARFFINNVASAVLPPTAESAQSLQLKWREVDVSDADPPLLTNRPCKVFLPLENKWCKGTIKAYNQSTHKFQVIYDGGVERWHCLGKERLALYMSLHDKLKLLMGSDGSFSNSEKRTITENHLVLAVDTEDSEGVFSHGDIVWAEDTGYPFWPAFVMGEAHARSCSLEICESTLAVQLFGSYECVRVSRMRAVEFSRGLQRDYHLKCKRVLFDRALDELDRYLKERLLPLQMAHLLEEATGVIVQNVACKQSGNNENEDFVGDERKYKVRKSLESIFKCPIKLGRLRVLSLGKIVKDSEYFHDQHYIWTEGYTAIRRFLSTRDPTKMINYKMEVVKNPIVRTMPLFRVTPEDGEQVEGASAALCWKKIFDKLQKAKGKLISNARQGDKRRQFYRSGATMFGFSHPRVSRLIQALPYARVCSKYKAWAEVTASEEVDGLLPAGFKHVEGDWKHLDRCSVCYTNEEYEGNVLLQCDRCRMLVHLNCYGVLEPPIDSWLCNLCDLRISPPCCLCPIQGGAMKRTTDGRWVHVACALWIPETCCVDMDRMEPIDGIQCINKERWKLTCTICNVPYGTCIQCADHHCRVAYHPLCARAAGFCTKVLEGLRRKRNQQTGAHEEERSVQLLSYCKKHMQGGRSKTNKDAAWSSNNYSYSVQNQSGCARSEPYNLAVRRGRREPEQYSAALAKRSFLENRPYIVTGCLRHPYQRKAPSSTGSRRRPFLTDDHVPLSMSQRFSQMRATVHQRLTFGKSAIHGWGLFAKKAHGAGDMVIEYAGEVIRPVVADVRERSCYNSLVGAGTYMFCIDDERVIDATRSGSIAHLINHSCEPNCYSRVVAARGRDRIIIFAKQDIAGGEEVTYDYRFTSMGEQLACHCGSAGCRGIVNVMDENDESGKILVNASEITRFTT